MFNNPSLSEFTSIAGGIGGAAPIAIAPTSLEAKRAPEMRSETSIMRTSEMQWNDLITAPLSVFMDMRTPPTFSTPLVYYWKTDST